MEHPEELVLLLLIVLGINKGGGGVTLSDRVPLRVAISTMLPLVDDLNLFRLLGDSDDAAEAAVGVLSGDASCLAPFWTNCGGDLISLLFLTSSW